MGGVCKQLCCGVQAAMWWVAHGILETAQSPNSLFPFLFDFGLGHVTWTRLVNIINLPCCTIVKIPASRIDKFSAGRTQCRSVSHVDKDVMEQSSTVP